MLYFLGFDQTYIPLMGALFAFFETIIFMKAFEDKLPHDQGREYAVEGSLSRGKARGAGLIFVPVYILTSLIFDVMNTEKIIYLAVICATMLTGYFDDASDKPWSEYLKGALDLGLAAVVGGTYLCFNGNSFMLLSSFAVTIPYPLAFILIVALIWISINVTNCTDGVDGLSATLTMITLGSFMVFSGGIFTKGLPELYFIVVLVAYLWYNATPSRMLMGDAGSRAMGMMIAITALASRRPLLFIPFALVMILDGGLGLLKVALLRFLKIKILTKVRCPIHDQVRKVNGWSNTQVVFRFAIIQFMICLIFLL